MENLVVYKHGVSLAFNDEVLAWQQPASTAYLFKGVYDTRYRRMQGERRWVETEKSIMRKYEALQEQLSVIEEELYELGADHEGGWYMPEGKWVVDYLETEEEWYDRCIELDKA